MAQKFGGQYSPVPQPANAQTPSDRVLSTPAPREIRHPHQNRPFWLLLCAGPMLVSGFGAGPEALARALTGFALIVLAEGLTREGLRAQAAYEARTRARRPAFPRKLAGALCFGLGLGLAAIAPEMGVEGALFVGATGLALHLLAFGRDPMRHKGMEGIDPFQQDRVARVVAEGERHLTTMKEAIARLEDRRLAARVGQFGLRAQDLFRRVEEEPADLTAARRYMGVYLQGAADATLKLADLSAQRADPQAVAGYEALLDDLESNFAALTARLAQGNREGLEIEIEVLRERLAREGLAGKDGTA